MAPHFKNDSSIYHELMHLSELIPSIYSLLLSKLSLSFSTKKGTEKKGNSVFLDSELLVHPSSVLTCEKPVIANDSAINRY